jgi:ribose transport system substrate-binding protein/inositol transport system substrate-binding protein
MADDARDFGEAKQIDIVYLADSINNNTRIILDACEARIEEFNDNNPQYIATWAIYDANQSVDRQITDMETAVAAGADVIILSAVDPVGLRAASEAAADQGVIIVDWRGTESTHENIIFFDGVNENDRAGLNKTWLKKYLDENTDTKLKVGLIGGSAAMVATLPRIDVPATLADEYPDRFEVVVQKFSDWTTDNAISIMEDWMQTYDGLNCIVAASEALAQGVVAVLNTLGVIDDFIIVAYGGEETGLRMIHNREIDCVAGVRTYSFGAGMIDVSLDAYVNGFRGAYSAGTENLRLITEENYQEVAEEMGIKL